MRTYTSGGLRNPRLLCTAQKCTSDSKRTDSHVASLLGMTVEACILPCLFPNGNIPPTGNPSVGYADSSPKKGAKMVRVK